MTTESLWNTDKTVLTLRVGQYYSVDLRPTEADCRRSRKWREGLRYQRSNVGVSIDNIRADLGHPEIRSDGTLRKHGPFYGLLLEDHASGLDRYQRLVGRPLHPHSGIQLNGIRTCWYLDSNNEDYSIRLSGAFTAVIIGTGGRVDDRHLHHDHATTNVRLAALESAMSGLALHLAPDAEDTPAALRALASFRKG